MMGFFFMKNNKTTLNAFKLLFKNGEIIIESHVKIEEVISYLMGFNI